MKRNYQFENTRVLMHTILKVHWDPKEQMPTMQEMWPLETDEPEDKISDKELAQQYKDMMAKAAEMYKTH